MESAIIEETLCNTVKSQLSSSPGHIYHDDKYAWSDYKNPQFLSACYSSVIIVWSASCTKAQWPPEHLVILIKLIRLIMSLHSLPHLPLTTLEPKGECNEGDKTKQSLWQFEWGYYNTTTTKGWNMEWFNKGKGKARMMWLVQQDGPL